MVKAASISLKDIIGSDTALIRELTDTIKSEFLERGLSHNEIVDFSGIRSISRAFAHSLICLIEEFQQKGTQIELSNVDPEISKLLELVNASRTGQQAHYRPELFPKRVSFDEASDNFEELH